MSAAEARIADAVSAAVVWESRSRNKADRWSSNQARGDRWDGSRSARNERAGTSQRRSDVRVLSPVLVALAIALTGCTSGGHKSAGGTVGGPAVPSVAAPSASTKSPLAIVTPTDAASSQSAAAAICQAGAPGGTIVVESFPVPIETLTSMHGGPPPGIYPYASLLAAVSPFTVAGWCEFRGTSGYFASVVSPSGVMLNQILGYGPSPTRLDIPSTGPYALP